MSNPELLHKLRLKLEELKIHRPKMGDEIYKWGDWFNEIADLQIKIADMLLWDT